MKEFSITPEQAYFFKEHRFIAFENLLENPSHLHQLIEGVLKQDLRNHHPISPHVLWPACHNLWRKSPELKKEILQRKWARIGSTLFDVPVIRFGYDHYIPYSQCLYPSPATLKEISSLQKVHGGLLLRLITGSSSSPEPFSVPAAAGSGLFFAPDIPVFWDRFFSEQNTAFLLIVYCSDRSQYILEPKDPLTHLPKRDGYGFGDKLNEETNPILFRSI